MSQTNDNPAEENENGILEISFVVHSREVPRLREDILDLPELNKPNGSSPDDSVIDITGQSYTISDQNEDIVVRKYGPGVPFWAHQYVYSTEELRYASNDQRGFYHYFKKAFLDGIFFDLEGNSNYAFILLFDLDDDYENHRDIVRLEKYFHALGQLFPKTKYYGRNLLLGKMEALGYAEGIERLREQQFDDEYWTFGSKYKKKLNLSRDEVKLLNKPSYPHNNFISIEYCCIRVIRLYLTTVQRLKVEYEKIGTTLNTEFGKLADLVARKQFRYRTGSQNHRYAIQSVSNEMYSIIFKHCENAVREHYGHKRKLNTDLWYSQEVKSEIDERLTSKIRTIIQFGLRTIEPPDEPTEIELNAQNTSRWKLRFHELTSKADIEGKTFVDDLIRLGRLNKRNPSIENIFFEGSKFVSKIDREAALVLYVYYLYYDLRSVKFDNKKLTKTIQKNLFRTNEHLHEFERIISEFVNDRNLEKALAAISEIYVVKRKQISLDKGAIEQAHHKHSDTVELLNEYLQDEFEDDQNAIVSREISDDEVQIEITSKNASAPAPSSATNLDQNQWDLLQLFAKCSFNISQNEADDFARSRGLFRNQLVDSINEKCYEILDDVLIEEEDEYYAVNEDYYSLILQV